MCDITNHIDCRRTAIALRDFMFNILDHSRDFAFVFIYCDLLQPVHVGDVEARLLKVLPVQIGERQYTCPTRTFHPICRDHIYDHIIITLRDEYGRSINTPVEGFAFTLQLRHSR